MSLEVIGKAIHSLPPEVIAALHPVETGCGVCAALLGRPEVGAQALWLWHDPKPGGGEDYEGLIAATQKLLERIPKQELERALQPIWGAMVHARCMVIYALAKSELMARDSNGEFVASPQRTGPLAPETGGRE